MENITIPGTSLLQQSKHMVHKSCLSLHNELHRNCSNGTKSKMEKENGKAVVRSRFFQHKSGKENNEDSADESPWADDDVFIKRKTCFYDGAQVCIFTLRNALTFNFFLYILNWFLNSKLFFSGKFKCQAFAYGQFSAERWYVGHFLLLFINYSIVDAELHLFCLNRKSFVDLLLIYFLSCYS